MPTRQEQRDAFARSKGYRNYFEYRNAQARAQGYASYTEQRRARQTGQGLRGEDVAKYQSVVPGHLNVIRGGGTRNTLLGPEQLTADLRQEYKFVQNWSAAAMTDIRLGGSTAQVKSELSSVLGTTQQKVRDYYANRFPKVYEAGAKSFDPNYKLTDSDRKRIAQLAADGRGDLLSAHERYQRTFGYVAGEMKNTNPSREATMRFDPRGGVRGITYGDGSRRRLDDYASAAINATASRAYNEGYLRASGAELFEVHDGPGCGWTSHRDSEAADGKIVTLEEALSFPIAHPHCRRTFEARPDLKGQTKKQLAQKALDIVSSHRLEAAASAVGVTALVLASNAQTRAAALNVLSKSNVFFKEMLMRAEEYARLWTFEHRAIAPLVDSVTGNYEKITARQVIEDVQSYAEDFAMGKPLPQHVQYILGVNPALDPAAQRVAGESGFFHLQTALNSNGKLFMSSSDLINIQRVERAAVNAFLDYIEPITGRYQHIGISFPKVGGRMGKRRTGRLRIDPARLIRFTRTRTVRDVPGGTIKVGEFTRKLPDTRITGWVNHLSINRHGIFRAGMATDAETGFWTPNFRVVPKGPIRLFTRVNRGKTGNITSVSTELRVITKTPLNFSLRFSTNLRALGLDSLWDVRHLRMGDFRRLKSMESQFVSLNADFQEGRMRLMKAGKFVSNITFNAAFRGSKQQLREIFFVDDVIDELLNERGLLEISEKAHTKAVRDRISIIDAKVQELLGQDPSLKAKLTAMSRLVSHTAQLRLSGYNVFDISRTFKISLEQAQKLLALADKQIQDNWSSLGNYIADLRANYRRKRFRVILGGGEGGPPPGPRPGSPLGKALGVPSDPLHPVPPLQGISYDPRIKYLSDTEREMLAVLADESDQAGPSLFTSFKSSTGLRPNTGFDLSALDEALATGDLDPKMYDDIVAVSNMIGERYPVHYGGIRYEIGETFGSNLMEAGIKDGRRIIRIDPQIAKFWSGDPFRLEYLDAILAGWNQPDRGDPASLIVHEVGHTIDSMLNPDERDELFRKLAKQGRWRIVTWGDISLANKPETVVRFVQSLPPEGLRQPAWYYTVRANADLIARDTGIYAGKTEGELIAELFSEYHTKPDPRPMAKTVGKFFDEKFGVRAGLRPGAPIPVVGPQGVELPKINKAARLMTEAIQSEDELDLIIDAGLEHIQQGHVDLWGVEGRGEAKSKIVRDLRKRLLSREDKPWVMTYSYGSKEEIASHIADGHILFMNLDTGNGRLDRADVFRSFMDEMDLNHWSSAPAFEGGFTLKDHMIPIIERYNEFVEESAIGSEYMMAIKGWSEDRQLLMIGNSIGEDFMVGAGPGIHQMLTQYNVDQVIANWAATSSGQDPLALSLQHSADRVFKTRLGVRMPTAKSLYEDMHTLSQRIPWSEVEESVKRGYETRAEGIAHETRQYIEDFGEEQMALIEEMYLHTQQQLEAEGIDQVVLYRGMQWYRTSFADRPRWAKLVDKQGEINYGFDRLSTRAHNHFTGGESELFDPRFTTYATGDVHLQPISSFATHAPTAGGFGAEDEGTLIWAVVPRERILSTSRTGFGALPEYEYVVIDGPGEWHIHNTTKFFKEHQSRVAKAIYSGPVENAYDIISHPEDYSPFELFAAQQKALKHLLSDASKDFEANLRAAQTDAEWISAYQEYHDFFWLGHDKFKEIPKLDGLATWEQMIYNLPGSTEMGMYLHTPDYIKFPVAMDDHFSYGNGFFYNAVELRKSSLLPPSVRKAVERLEAKYGEDLHPDNWTETGEWAIHARDEDPDYAYVMNWMREKFINV